MSLIAAIKKFRQFKTQDTYCQTLSWPVEAQFVQNKSLNCTFIKELSKFVDNKLADYAAIQGSIPATQEFQSEQAKLQITNTTLHTFSNGQLDTNINRSKDCFLRLPPQHSQPFDAAIEAVSLERQPPAHIEGHTVIRFGQQQLNLSKNISYVTSYDVDYKSLILKANILTTSDWLDSSLEMWIDGPKCASQIIKDAIQANLVINSFTRSDIPKKTEAEKQALLTLREIISEQDFRRYLRYGFLLVKSSSGKIYQIWGNKSHTKVFWKGQRIEEICVRLRQHVPPTDNVIAFKIMIETDEQEFRNQGNIYKMAA